MVARSGAARQAVAIASRTRSTLRTVRPPLVASARGPGSGTSRARQGSNAAAVVRPRLVSLAHDAEHGARVRAHVRHHARYRQTRWIPLTSVCDHRFEWVLLDSPREARRLDHGRRRARVATIETVHNIAPPGRPAAE